jgi:hypothetical protein
MAENDSLQLSGESVQIAGKSVAADMASLLVDDRAVRVQQAGMIDQLRMQVATYEAMVETLKADKDLGPIVTEYLQAAGIDTPPTPPTGAPEPFEPEPAISDKPE